MPFDSTTATNLQQQLGLSTGAALIVFATNGTAQTRAAVEILGAIGTNGKPLSPAAVPSYLSTNAISLSPDQKHN